MNLQEQFAADMLRAGFTVRKHPLHGGREVNAVEARFERAADKFAENNPVPHVQDVYRATALRLATDQVGYNVVLYAVGPAPAPVAAAMRAAQTAPGTFNVSKDGVLSLTHDELNRLIDERINAELAKRPTFREFERYLALKAAKKNAGK